MNERIQRMLDGAVPEEPTLGNLNFILTEMLRAFLKEEEDETYYEAL